MKLGKGKKIYVFESGGEADLTEIKDFPEDFKGEIIYEAVISKRLKVEVSRPSFKLVEVK